MAASCKAIDGSVIADGETATLDLRYGDVDHFAVVSVTGDVRSFDQDGETRWEIVTGDPQWPAVGFRPENVLTKKV